MDTHVDRETDAYAIKNISSDYPMEDRESFQRVVLTDYRDVIRNSIPTCAPHEAWCVAIKYGMDAGQWCRLSGEEAQGSTQDTRGGHQRGNAAYKP